MSSQLVMLTSVIIISAKSVIADYRCVCMFDTKVHPVYQKPNTTSSVLGFIPPNQCKSYLYPVKPDFAAVMVYHQIGFLPVPTPFVPQICTGNPSSTDVVTESTKTTNLMTASSSSSSSAVRNSTSSTPDSSTALTTETTTLPTVTTATPHTSSTTEISRSTLDSTTPYTQTTNRPTVTAPVVPEGHTSLCPDYIKTTDVSYYNGFLGQYGDYCYELINGLTQWDNARRHCIIYGDLVHIPNQDVQNFITNWLNANNFTSPVWIGLTDNGETNEGTWRWSSAIDTHDEAGKTCSKKTAGDFAPDYYNPKK